LNDKVDKKVWVLWMEGRIHEEYHAIETPVGFIPVYDDLKNLFKQVFNKDFTRENYVEQFSIRVSKSIDRLDRMDAIYKAEPDIPEVFHKHISQQRERLLEAKEKFGKDTISPFDFEE